MRSAVFAAAGVIALLHGVVALPTAPVPAVGVPQARQWDGDGSGPYTYFGDKKVRSQDHARQWDGDGTGEYTYFGDKKARSQEHARQWDGDGTGPYTYFGDKKARDAGT